MLHVQCLGTVIAVDAQLFFTLSTLASVILYDLAVGIQGSSRVLDALAEVAILLFNLTNVALAFFRSSE